MVTKGSIRILLNLIQWMVELINKYNLTMTYLQTEHDVEGIVHLVEKFGRMA